MTLRIHRVTPGSPAAEEGLKPGAKLTAIDGKSAAEWRLAGLRELLRKGPGHQLSISVEQDGRQATFRIKLRRLL